MKILRTSEKPGFPVTAVVLKTILNLPDIFDNLDKFDKLEKLDKLETLYTHVKLSA